MGELDDAIRAVDEWAEKKCRACGQQRQLALYGYRFEGLQRLTTVTVGHTCREYKARAKRLALAVAYEAATGGALDPLYSRVKAKLDWQWPESDKEVDTMTASDSKERVR